MKRLLFVTLAATTLASCGGNALLTELNRVLVSGGVTMDGVAEPARATLIRVGTGEVGDSETTGGIIGAGFQLADEWDGPCNWRVEVEFTNIVADSAFLAGLSGPLVVEEIGCGSQAVTFDLTTN
jgi:hypothetical protein